MLASRVLTWCWIWALECQTAPTAPDTVASDDGTRCGDHAEFPPHLYPHCVKLQAGLFMYYGKSGDFVRMGMFCARHSGWSALALSDNGGMKGADEFVVRVVNGEWVVEDRHSESYNTPQMDKQQNVELAFAQEIDGNTAWGVLLPINSCDTEDDQLIEDYDRYLLWALGTGHDFHHHGPKRGSFKANLISGPQVYPPLPTNLLTAEMRMPNVTLNGAATINTVFDLAELLPEGLAEGKLSLVGVDHAINANYVHHVWIYSCTEDELYDPDDIFSTFSNGDKIPKKHLSVIPDGWTVSCKNTVYVWGVGSTSFRYPENVGYPLGAAVGRRWIMLQTHYYTPEFPLDGIIDHSGFNLMISSTLSPIEAGLMSITSVADAIQRPSGLEPNQPNLEIFPLYLPKSCTEAWEHDEIHVLGTYHHQHELGKRQAVTVFRDGERVGVLRRERLYDDNHQAFLEGPVKTIKRGDSILHNCVFDTSTQRGVTPFGVRLQNERSEMCVAVLLYYPALGSEPQTLYAERSFDGGQNHIRVVTNPYCPRNLLLAGTRAVVAENPKFPIETCTKTGDLASALASSLKDAMRVAATKLETSAAVSVGHAAVASLAAVFAVLAP